MKLILYYVKILIVEFQYQVDLFVNDKGYLLEVSDEIVREVVYLIF